MALDRGIQSAIFYYVSCTPCLSAAHRKRRKRQAAMEKAEKEALHVADPTLYRHPDPGAVNPYWREEMELGPGPPPQRAPKRTNNTSTRGIASAGTQSSMGSKTGSSDDVSPMEAKAGMTSDDTLHDENWNRRKGYQREDEELWGEDDPTFCKNRSRTGTDTTGSSIGVNGLSKPAKAAEKPYTTKIVATKDLSPVVVGMPSGNMTWMMQPPPKAKIMEGKERVVNRSRSGSGTSSQVDLSRQVSLRRAQDRLGRADTLLVPTLSRDSSYRRIQGQRHDRQTTSNTGSIRSTASTRDKIHARPPIADDDSDSSDDTIVHTPTHLTPDRRARDVEAFYKPRPNRPELSTIMSSGSASPPSATSPTLRPQRKENQATRVDSKLSKQDGIDRRDMQTSWLSDEIFSPVNYQSHKPVLVNDSSLNLIEELVSPEALLKSNFIKSPTLEARIQLPPVDSEERAKLRRQVTRDRLERGRDLDSDREEEEPRQWIRRSVDF